MKNWNEFEIFKCVDLEDSYVIGWKCGPESFFIDMEASLWPGHSLYEPPQNNEYTCYKKARLVFREPRNICGLKNINQVKPNAVLEEELPDYDTIEEFKIGFGEFQLSGRFGNVTLLASDWEFMISNKCVKN